MLYPDIPVVDSLSICPQILHPTNQSSFRHVRISDMVDEWKNWRGIDSREHVLFMHFLRGEFQGKAEILEQMKSVEVMRINPEGSLRLRSGGPLAEVKDSDYPSPRANWFLRTIAMQARVLRHLRIASLSRCRPCHWNPLERAPLSYFAPCY